MKNKLKWLGMVFKILDGGGSGIQNFMGKPYLGLWWLTVSMC